MYTYLNSLSILRSLISLRKLVKCIIDQSVALFNDVGGEPAEQPSRPALAHRRRAPAHVLLDERGRQPAALQQPAQQQGASTSSVAAFMLVRASCDTV